MKSTVFQLFGEVGIRDYIERSQSRAWKGILLHHSASPTAAQYEGIETIRAIERYHIDVNKWRAIGYNFVFAPDGSIFTGRPLDMVGAHAGTPNAWALKEFGGSNGPNQWLIGLCAIGNYDNGTPSEALKDSLRLVSRLLAQRFDLDYWLGHYEVHATACPGKALKGFEWMEPLDVKAMFATPSPWAADTWARFRTDGIVDGSAPLQSTSREMTAVMIERAIDKYCVRR